MGRFADLYSFSAGFDRRDVADYKRVYEVCLCKNRRTELRARQAWRARPVGAAPSCVVDLPPRPTSSENSRELLAAFLSSRLLPPLPDDQSSLQTAQR